MNNQSHRGLSSAEVEIAREKHGSNAMTKRRGKSIVRLFWENLGDPVIRVLLITLAANILFTFHDIDWFETAGIIIAILVATTVSTLSEHSSKAAFEKLNASVSSFATVRRDGKTLSIPTCDVVVGDVVLLSAGDKVCADGILIGGSLSLDQSTLTGESKEVPKFPSSDENASLSPTSPHSCLRGSLVSAGEGEMVVRNVGDRTFLGGIVGELQVETRESPLKLRLAKLAKQISLLGYGAAAVIALISFISSLLTDTFFIREVIMSRLTNVRFVVSELLHSITLGLTVVIMAVPEGLPMMIAVVLSSNVRKMLHDNVLVRKQTGIEAAGSMNILFTDKTGTLTRGKMSVESFILADGSTVSGVNTLKKDFESVFRDFCTNALYNTSSKLSGRKILGGNATERALLESVKRYADAKAKIVTSKQPFDSKTKLSSATLGSVTYKKGAPEILLPQVSSDNIDRAAIERAIAIEQSNGKRVIAMTKNNTFTCAVVISDPPRREARASVEALKNAGIRTVMITGDGILTAKSIAMHTGIVNRSHDLCLTHEELDGMSDTELSSLLHRLAVVARALPQDKSRLVRLSQERGLVVGMTGDGINDAPALRLSDVGFAMGCGSDVAKEAGDVVILDNNLSSIVKAVLYGRNIFKSIRKFLVFQLTVNFSSALVCFLGPLFGFETPITVSQMLWVNMIMDTLGGLAFAGEAPHKRIMRDRPKRRDEPILNGYMVHQIFISGTFSALLSISFLKLPFFTSHFRESANDRVLLSAFFGLFIFIGVAQCINSRTDRLNLFSGMSKNPAFILIMLLISAIQLSFIYFGGEILRATPLSPRELCFTVVCATAAIPFEFCRKMLWRFSGHSEGF